MKLSIGEETLALHLRAHKIPFEREVRFCPTRKWSVDFVIGTLAIEVEGGTWQIGRHQRGKGFAADCEKYNMLTRMGYRLLRYTTEMVTDGTAINDLLEICSAPTPSSHYGR